jgi:hypothetical protein
VFELVKDDVDDRFAAQSVATDKALASAEKAVEKAERLAEIRAETQDRLANERAKVNGTYVTSAVWDTAHGVLVDKVAALERRHEADLTEVRTVLGEIKGRGLGVTSAWVWMFIGLAGAISLLTLVIDLIFKH